MRTREVAHGLHGGLQRRGTVQHHAAGNRPQAEHVAVRVDQARQHGLALHIDMGGALGRLAFHLRGAADGQQLAPVVKRQRRKTHHLAICVERVAVGIVDDGIGVGVAKGAQAGEREQGTAQGQGRHFHLQVF
ncbi:MAG: hypothetical protein RSH52_20085 [Janthinobacterium sp.]